MVINQTTHHVDTDVTQSYHTEPYSIMSHTKAKPSISRGGDTETTVDVVYMIDIRSSHWLMAYLNDKSKTKTTTICFVFMKAFPDNVFLILVKLLY